MPAPLIERVRASNTATESENRIHDDEVAGRLGFRAGLVPGAELHGYLERLPERAWGERWPAGGAIRVRFLRPVYDGEEVELAATPGAPGTSLELALRNPAGELCAAGTATVSAAHEPLPEVPAAGLPVPRPPAAFAAGEVLGTVDEAEAGGPAGGGRLVWLANRVLMLNRRLPVWIHVESRTRYAAAVPPDRRLSARARVAELYERRGHRLVELDVLVLAGDAPIAAVRHIAIYEPAPPGRRAET